MIQSLYLLITPLVSGIIAVIAAFIAIRFDARKTINQELIKKRISVYDLAVPKLNDFLCFFLIVGSWKTLNPLILIQRKRELDQIMHVYGPIFNPEVFRQYQIFIHTCFETFTGVGRDARVRADQNILQKNWGADWKAEWDEYLVAPNRTAKKQDVMREYSDLLAIFASEIGARQARKKITISPQRWWIKLSKFYRRVSS